MQNIKLLFGVLTVSLSSMVTVNTALAANTKSFGKGSPFSIDDLPPGLLKQKLNQLPPAAQKRAVNWLHQFDFTEQDIPTLRVDKQGGVFYQDPAPSETAESVSSPVLSGLTQNQTFSLHSKPGASRVVHLDMDGRVVTGTVWNTNAGADPLYMRPYDSDGNEASFSQTELNAIAETWRRIAEDFAPFDIDVTTEEPTTYGPNVGVILVTPKADQNGNLIYSCSCGGVAYVGIWGASYYENYQPALVFTDGVGKGPHNISEAASHELGHNLGLSHDGTNTQGYYAGHGSGNTSWAPIMGVGYYQNVTQWSKGEYQNASQQQDDLQLIAERLTYRVDDHVNSNVNLATPLVVTNSTQVLATNPVSDPVNSQTSNKGIIEHQNDVDLFALDVGAGDISLSITPAWVANYYNQSLRGMNADIQATLYDASGSSILASSNIIDDTQAQINVNVSAGRYILAIEGVGKGDPLIDGYSAYGAIGQYFISGTVPAPVTLTEKPPVPTSLTASITSETTIELAWVDPVSSPENNETGYRIMRSKDGGEFIEINTAPSDSEVFIDDIQLSGSYRYQVIAYNAIGVSPSNISNDAQIDVPVVATVAVVTSEQSVTGSVIAGSYLNTQQIAGSQTLSEQHQGGRPARRVTELSHIWSVTGITSGNSVMLQVIAQAPSNNENDNFTFEYAINGGAYQPLGVLYHGSGQQSFFANLPLDTEGSLTVRVTDSDKTVGNADSNTLSVSYIAVVTNGEQLDLPPQVIINSPSDNDVFLLSELINFNAEAVDEEDGDISSNITWSSQLDGVIGMGESIAVSNLSSGLHQISATVTDSENNVASAMIAIMVQADIQDIQLSVAANKSKGKHTPLLTWSNAQSNQVDIYRNGNVISTVANSGSYTDQTGNKGGATYVYQVCEQGTSQCSAEVNVVY